MTNIVELFSKTDELLNISLAERLAPLGANDLENVVATREKIHLSIQQLTGVVEQLENYRNELDVLCAAIDELKRGGE